MIPPRIHQIEDELLCVPRELFTMHSLVFRDIFSLPQATPTSAEGASDDNPLRLENYKKDEVKSLLKVIIRTCVSSKFPSTVVSHTYQHWLV